MSLHVEALQSQLKKIRANPLSQSEKILEAIQNKINKVGALSYEVAELHSVRTCLFCLKLALVLSLYFLGLAFVLLTLFMHLPYTTLLLALSFVF